MRPLTLDDLLPLEEFANRRREFFDSLQRYLDQYRRVRLGPRLTLRFENRQTLWFQVQEMIRIARLRDPQLLQRELDLYNRLLPGPNQLQAALIITITDASRLTEELTFWQGLTGGALRLVVGKNAIPATLTTCRPEDRCTGAAHWLQFAFDAFSRKALSDSRQPAFLRVEYDTYHHDSPPLSDDVRQSLLDDLELSDRDAA
ncbi:MAG: DUF3501 family protein [Gemmataceae bacterium]